MSINHFGAKPHGNIAGTFSIADDTFIQVVPSTGTMSIWQGDLYVELTVDEQKDLVRYIKANLGVQTI